MELKDFTNEEIIDALRCNNTWSCIDCDKMVFCCSPRHEIENLLADRLESLITQEDDWECK